MLFEGAVDKKSMNLYMYAISFEHQLYNKTGHPKLLNEGTAKPIPEPYTNLTELNWAQKAWMPDSILFTVLADGFLYPLI